MAKSPHTPEWRVLIAQEYLNGQGSSYDIAERYKIHASTISRWTQRYKEQGIFAFSHRIGNARYTSDFKLMCVELYVSGEMSMDEIVARNKIFIETKFLT